MEERQRSHIRELSRHLGADYPFYGLQARGVDGSNDYLTTTEAMAESYLREMRELQLKGPYYLGGFCMGGQVAFEMARRLAQDGQQVKLLFVIDTHNFNGVPPQLSLKEKVGHLGQKIKFHSSKRHATGPQWTDCLPFRKIKDCPAKRNGAIAIQDRPSFQAESAPRRLGACTGNLLRTSTIARSLPTCRASIRANDDL